MPLWKRNLIFAWFGSFMTSAGMSLVVPFLPLFIENLGITDHKSVSIWSGIITSATFIVSASISPLWGKLADRKGRKLMLLRAALGMAIVITLTGFVTNVYYLLLLRLLLGLTSGFNPNASALIASQAPREKSGSALSILSTGATSGLLIGPLIGGLLADAFGIRMAFFITGAIFFVNFFTTFFFIKEEPTEAKERKVVSGKLFKAVDAPHLIFGLFVCTTLIQLALNSINPILTLYVRDIAGHVSNISFISGLIVSLPGFSALFFAPRLGKLGDKIGTEKVLITALVFSVIVMVPMAFVTNVVELGALRFLLGMAQGSLIPAVQSLLVKNTPHAFSGRVFSYNQSFFYIGNILGPLIGSAVSATLGLRAVFLVTAIFVLINAVLSWRMGRTIRTHLRESANH